MMDQYKEQYNRETEQIHAPAELIARTKAAMREEERRILQMSASQMAEAETRGIREDSGMPSASDSDRKYVKRSGMQKWAYPLTAAAVLFILMSVSMMMKGINSRDMSMSEAPQTEAAMEASKASGGEDLDGGMAEDGAVMEPERAAETTESAYTDEVMSAEADMAVPPASEAETKSMSGAAAETEDRKQHRKHGDKEESAAAEAAEAPAEEVTQGRTAADTTNITIEKVAERPDFCRRSDVAAHIFEGEIFHVAEEESGWAAYVEVENREKYVIRGEAQDLEAFLEAGYRKLVEQMEKGG